MVEQILASLAAIAVLSGLGAAFIGMSEENLGRVVEYLVSLSAGTILGGVFIHLVFRMANSAGYTRQTGLMVLAGIVLSLVLERAIHWHCHHRDTHVEPLSYNLLAGDAVHNVLDGILIATSFLAGTSSGLAATVAVMAHKIPKEAGDFGVLVHSGVSATRAVLFNLGVSLFMFVGALAVVSAASMAQNTVPILLPLVVGNFVYIAGSDLLPEFKKTDDGITLHIVMFSLGVAVMYAIPFLQSLV